MSESRSEFEAWWAHEREQNSGNEIGADYRHWALLGYLAALEEAAKACDDLKEAKNEFGARTRNHYGPVVATGALMCSQAIRALSKAQEGQS
jgi:hypothetical protein